jgi:tRNA modification GTPase
MSDTIAAIATGSQLSAIGIIRLSGDTALEVIDRVFTPQSGKPMSARPDRLLVLGELKDTQGALLDLCLCTVSRGPNSYTGENTAELQCHGSPTVLREALEALFKAGARQAGPGEFTKRAFLNGRMDLTQAEAVVDLINAETAEAAKNAAGQLGGAISHKLDKIYTALSDISAHYHAVIDYPDEDIDPFELVQYTFVLDDAETSLTELLQSFERGRILHTGITAAILGRPNVGKSSLLNGLLGYDRAIVTDIPGTTRDTIEEKIRLGGVLLRLTDTAGLRETLDPVEQLGVSRAKSAATQADLALAVFDSSSPLTDSDLEVLETAKQATHAIAILNKSDLPQQLSPDFLSGQVDAICVLSAKTGDGLDTLAQQIAALYPLPEDVVCGEILTNARQADAVSRALSSITGAKEAMLSGLTPDAVLTDTEQAMSALGECIGKTVTEDVTARIFQRFCVGK